MNAEENGLPRLFGLADQSHNISSREIWGKVKMYWVRDQMDDLNTKTRRWKKAGNKELSGTIFWYVAKIVVLLPVNYYRFYNRIQHIFEYLLSMKKYLFCLASGILGSDFECTPLWLKKRSQQSQHFLVARNLRWQTGKIENYAVWITPG